ncbi:MAG: hypothetical protein ACREOW_18640 [Thermodesulfobacteriota bacterium]
MKIINILLFLLLFWLIGAGCNNSGRDGSQPGDGIPPGPLPGDGNGGPTLNFPGIGIDYDPEARCADNVTNWMGNPVACNPQPSFSCASCSGAMPLTSCPTCCQQCYVGDFATLKTLGVGAITIYQPNIYILTAAQNAGTKVILGTFNDAVPSLAMPDSETDCTYAGTPLFLCGSKYADALLDGACIDTTPWPSSQFCANHCSNNPNMLCSTNSDCSGGTCLSGAFVEAFGSFLQNGTVIGIQLGNEFFNGSNASEISTAAQTLRGVLNQRGFNNIPIIISLIAGQGSRFCSGSEPPAGVDLIATHPYCNFVASIPPSWQFDNNPGGCLQQVQTLFSQDATACGTANTFIGETGYNTGCPMQEGTSHIAPAQAFIQYLVQWQCGDEPNPQVDPPVATFLFAFVDACPPGGCQAGCSGSGLPNIGNGYFGLFFTEGYQTEGTLMPKFSPTPSLTCQ